MRSELFRIPLEIGGVPLFGMGVLLVAWILFCAALLWWQSRSHGWTAELRGQLPVMLLVAAALAFLPRLFPEGLPIRGYGVMVLVGALVGIWLATIRARQMGLAVEFIYSLAFGMFLCGFIGARTFYVIEYWETDFRGEGMRKILMFTEGGLVVYGALIGASVALIVYVRKFRLPLLAVADLIAPSLLVGLAFGRLGCLLNGCCYGGVCELPWAATFPQGSPPYEDQVVHGNMFGFRVVENADGLPVVTQVDADSRAAASGLAVGDIVAEVNGEPVDSFATAARAFIVALERGAPLGLTTADGKSIEIAAPGLPARSLPVHPTQVYSAINAALLAWLLWASYPFRRWDGQVVAIMLTVYPITRFLLEIIRTDESAIFGTGMSISQNVSLAMLLAAAGLWGYLWIKGQPPKQQLRATM